MYKYFFTILLLLLAYAEPVSAMQRQEYFKVDESFCHGRGLLGKAAADARRMGVSRQKWVKDLYITRTKLDNRSLLYSAIPMALLDVDLIYSGKPMKNTNDIYVDMFKDCMGFRGRTIAFYSP